MSNGLAEQIAVLDGLDGLDMSPEDGRIGQVRAKVDQYGRPMMPGVLTRRHVLDPSEGANYSGGSDYAAGLPLLPSTVGLADIEPPPIRGGYGRAGLGDGSKPLIRGGYGAAGMGQTATYADEDLAAASDTVTTVRDGVRVQTSSMVSPSRADGRIGQVRGQVDQYGRVVMPGVLARRYVLDPSEGANYGGGSDYAPGMPLLASTVGLAGMGNIPNVLPPKMNVIDPSGGANYTGGSDYAPGIPLTVSSAGLAELMGLGDLADLDYVDDDELFEGLEGRFGRRLRRLAGKARVKKLKRTVMKAAQKASPVHQIARRTKAGRKLMSASQKLNLARRLRAKVMASKMGRAVRSAPRSIGQTMSARLRAQLAARGVNVGSRTRGAVKSAPRSMARALAARRY